MNNNTYNQWSSWGTSRQLPHMAKVQRMAKWQNE